MVEQVETVTVGQIERPFGVKGEVKVRSLTDVPGRWEALTAVCIVGKHGQTLATAVTHVRRAGNGLIVGLAGLTNPEDAGLWRGGLIQAPRTDAPALPEGVYYECDLVGLAVQNERGESIGVLEDILELPGNPLFAVRQGTKEILIPAAKDLIIAVDLPRGRMTVRMIQGLGE
jgi:16S rRNA processing protein RimM